jgi:hypothetical protein
MVRVLHSPPFARSFCNERKADGDDKNIGTILHRQTDKALAGGRFLSRAKTLHGDKPKDIPGG